MLALGFVPAVPWTSDEGGFTVDLASEGFHATVVANDESFFAVEFAPPASEFLFRVQRFRRIVPVDDAAQFEAVIEGVLIGIEEGLRPMKVLERKVDLAENRARADFVLRGRRLEVDIIERRRLIADGPVPPGALFLLTAACPAERFLVHRREFEALFDSFRTSSSAP
jgi:hypothetical protein